MKLNSGHVYLLVFLVAILLVAGALNRIGSSAGYVPPPPVPTVDIDQARQAFASGGALSYADFVALQHDIVGDAPDPTKIEDIDKYYELYDAYDDKWRTFGEQLTKCRLKESVGWLTYYGEEIGDDRTPVPGVINAYVSMVDPYSGAYVDVDEYPSVTLYLTDMGEEQVAQLRLGGKLRFSGDWAELSPVTIKNVKYELLPDDFSGPTVTPAEYQDLRVVLDRTMCFGSCPDYTLTIEGNGEVTFEGRHYTRVTGTAKGTVDEAQIAEIVREIQRADFFALDDDYSVQVTDNPTYTLIVQMGGKTKKVSSYAAGPLKLYILHRRIDQIVNSRQWIK